MAYWSHSGLKNRTATAATTSAVPSQPTMFRMFLIMATGASLPLTLPPLGVHRTRGQEKPERHHAEVVNEVLGVENASREVVEVIGNRQVIEHALSGRPGK